MQSHIKKGCDRDRRCNCKAASAEESDHVPADCLERDYLDSNLLRPVPIRSQRFSYVVVTRTASPQCSQRLIGTRSAVDPCQNTPDRSSVLVSHRSHPDGPC